MQIESNSPAAGTRVAGLRLPEGSRLISVFRHGRTELVEPGTVMRPGDQVLAVVADDAGARAPQARCSAPRSRCTAGGLQAPVVAGEEHDDGDDLEPADPHEPIIVIFETSPSGANEPIGPVIPNPGPTFPSAVAEAAERVERPEIDTGDRRVDAR